MQTYNSYFNFWNKIYEFLEKYMKLDPICEIMKEEPSIMNTIISDNKKELKPISSIDNIKFKNITFRYSEKDRLILKNTSLSFNKGENVSIIGDSGCGKSTTTHLLFRLYNPTSGTILVNN